MFQDVQTGIRISSGREYNDFYYFDNGTLHYVLVAISPSETPLQCFKKPRYNSLYNVTPTNHYVTGLKNAIFDNYDYFARNLRYVINVTHHNLRYSTS